MSTVPASAFVNVVPSVLEAGGDALDLNGMMLTPSNRIPPGTFRTFTSAQEGEDFFGAATDDAQAVADYFAGFDGSTVKPGALLTAQYNTAATSALLRGSPAGLGLTLAQLQALSGAFNVTIDGVAKTSTPSLAAATSFSNAAQIIETALAVFGPQAAAFTASLAGTTLTVTAVAFGALAVGQHVTSGGMPAGQYITGLGTGTGGTGTYTVALTSTISSTSMTAFSPAVSYDSVGDGFLVTSGTTGAASTIGYASGALATSLLMTQAAGATTAQGVVAAVPATFMNALASLTQNWATFFFAFNPDASGNAIRLAMAAWCSGQNSRYLFACWDADVAPSTTVPATSSLGYLVAQNGYAGTALIGLTTFRKAAFLAGAVASIDFARTNGRAALAYRSQAGQAADVTDLTAMNNLLSNGYSCYVAVGTANDDSVYFWNGAVSGDFLWIDSYVNQIWLNNAFQLALIDLLKNSLSVPYNDAGRAQIESALADPINAGLNFGAFRAGGELSAAQASAVNAAAAAAISGVLQNRGWYLQVGVATAQVRAARESPPCTFWYMDGGAVQKITLASIAVQ